MKHICLFFLLALASLPVFARPMSEVDLNNHVRMYRQAMERQLYQPALTSSAQPVQVAQSPAQQPAQTAQQPAQTALQQAQAVLQQAQAVLQQAQAVLQQAQTAAQQAQISSQQAQAALQQAQAALQQPAQVAAQPAQPPPQPVQAAVLDPKSLAVSGITEELINQGSFGLLIGVFPTGTSQDVVLNDGLVYLNYLGYFSGNETIEKVVAGTDPTDPDSEAFIAGSSNNYLGTAPLFTLYRDDFVQWTGSGTFDVWIGLFDGNTGYLYQARNVSFSSALTTIPAANFSFRHSERL